MVTVLVVAAALGEEKAEDVEVDVEVDAVADESSWILCNCYSFLKKLKIEIDDNSWFDICMRYY
jgi:hypothetical protein